MAAIDSKDIGKDADELLSAIKAIAKVAKAKTWTPAELEKIDSALSNARKLAVSVPQMKPGDNSQLPLIKISRPEPRTTYIVITPPFLGKKFCPTCKREL